MPAGELAELPSDTLAAWVADLTWLVEDLRAEAARAAVLADAREDSLRLRLALADATARMAEGSRSGRWRRAWEAVDEWITAILVLLAVGWARE